MSYIFFISVIAVVVMVLAVASFTSFELDDYHYDRLKWITMRWSYIVTFIALIVKTFDISYGIETVTIVAGIGAMFAGLLDISTKEYEKRPSFEEEEIDDIFEEEVNDDDTDEDSDEDGDD